MIEQKIARPHVDMVADSSTYDELPLDIVKLPSKGKLYPLEHPLHKKEVIEFKAMTAEEENILATPALLKQGTVLNVLIKSCLIDKTIDPLSLLIGDKSALLLAIRISGFGPEYKAQTVCSKCKQDFPHEFNLSNSKIKELTADPVEPGKNLFEYTLPKSKAKVKFSLTTDGDDLEVLKIQQNKKKFIKSALIDTTITDRLTLAVQEVNGNSDKEYIAKFVSRMPAKDSRALRSYMGKIEPEMIMEEEVSCKHCGERTVHQIPMGTEFFWPQIED